MHPSAIDASTGWIHLESATLPLVEALRPFVSTSLDEPITAPSVIALFERFKITEQEAHRRLAGAIWLTSREGQVIAEQVGDSQPLVPLEYTFPISIAQRLQPADELADYAKEVLNAAADWLVRETLETPPGLLERVRRQLLDGKTIFLLIGTAVSGLNLVHNLVMGRLLSPAAYGQLTLLITIQLLFGLFPTAAQTVSARYSARYVVGGQRDHLLALYRYGQRWLFGTGVVFGIAILVLGPWLTRILQMDSVWLFLPIAAALPWFAMMGLDRGMLQGEEQYNWLSASYAAEGGVRFVASIGLAVALAGVGRALDGAVWGVAQGMVLAWLVAWAALRTLAFREAHEQNIEDRAEWRALFGVTVVSLLGQALITNSDFVLVKTFFTTDDAGLYAAISVIGRITYFGALPVLVLMVPLISRRQALDEPTLPLFALLAGGVGAICFALIVVSALFAPFILRLLYGAAYVPAAGLLPIYTVAAALFVLTNFVITYRVSLGRGDEAWMPLLAGVLQIGGIIIFHDSLLQVILVQVILMSILLLGVLWRVFGVQQSSSG